MRAYDWMNCNADIIVPQHDWKFFEPLPGRVRWLATAARFAPSRAASMVAPSRNRSATPRGSSLP